MFNDNFRLLMSEIYNFNSKLSFFKKITGESPARCFELPLAVENLEMKLEERLLDIGAGDSCFGLFMMIYKKNVSLLYLNIFLKDTANRNDAQFAWILLKKPVRDL